MADHTYYELFDELQSGKPFCQDCRQIIKGLRDEYEGEGLNVLAVAWAVFWDWLTGKKKKEK
jgi:hypothetical protein